MSSKCPSYITGFYLKSFELIAPELCGKYLLDVGCGNGVYLNRFQGCSVGLDGSVPALRQCRSRELDVLACNLNSDILPLESESFEAVLCSHVLEHVEAPIRLLQECNRVLIDEGTLVIGLPIEGAAKRFREGYFAGHAGEHGHIYSFTLDNMKTLLQRTGFQVCTICFEIPRLTRMGAPLFFFRLGNLLPVSVLFAVSHAYWIVASKRKSPISGSC